MSFKSSYNGLKRTNWDNKTDRQKAKTLQKHFEKLGYKIPQYLKGNKISDVQLQKALHRVDTGYRKRINKEDAQSYMKNFNKNTINKAYREYSKAIKQDSSNFIQNLINQGYSSDVISAFKDDSISLSSKFKIINKPRLTPLTKENILNMSKRMNMHPVDLMNRLKNETISNKESNMKESILSMIDNIYSSRGYGLMGSELNRFSNMLDGHDYMGLSLTIQTLEKRLEREDFVDYDLRRGTSDRKEVNEQIEELLMNYNKVNTRVLVKATKEYY